MASNVSAMTDGLATERWIDDRWAAVLAGRYTASDFSRFAEPFADETELEELAEALERASK